MLQKPEVCPQIILHMYILKEDDCWLALEPLPLNPGEREIPKTEYLQDTFNAPPFLSLTTKPHQGRIAGTREEQGKGRGGMRHWLAWERGDLERKRKKLEALLRSLQQYLKADIFIRVIRWHVNSSEIKRPNCQAAVFPGPFLEVIKPTCEWFHIIARRTHDGV